MFNNPLFLIPKNQNHHPKLPIYFHFSLIKNKKNQEIVKLQKYKSSYENPWQITIMEVEFSVGDDGGPRGGDDNDSCKR
jgi:hypothetical protein